MKTSKFLIAENPLVDDGRVFIVHMREPVIIAEVFHFDLDQEKAWMECKAKFEIGATVDFPGELICLGVIYNGAFGAGTHPEKIMSRMGDWYYSYLKWQDDQIDDDTFGIQ